MADRVREEDDAINEENAILEERIHHLREDLNRAEAAVNAARVKQDQTEQDCDFRLNIAEEGKSTLEHELDNARDELRAFALELQSCEDKVYGFSFSSPHSPRREIHPRMRNRRVFNETSTRPHVLHQTYLPAHLAPRVSLFVVVRAIPAGMLQFGQKDAEMGNVRGEMARLEEENSRVSQKAKEWHDEVRL